MTQITARSTAGAFVAHEKRRDFFARPDSFNRGDRGDFLTFLKRTDIRLSEIFWNLGSAESTYRIDRGAFFAFFARTDILLSRTLCSPHLQRSKWGARPRPGNAVCNPQWKPGLVPPVQRLTTEV